jgi:hypothetical protein
MYADLIKLGFLKETDPELGGAESLPIPDRFLFI